MRINNKENHLSRIRISCIMLLFAMCLTIHVLFYSNYNLYELLDKTAVTETRAISESTVANGNGDNTAKNNSDTGTITKNLCPILMIAAIPKGFSLSFFLIIVFLFSFLALFILLPDKWTLINQKVRLDN